MPAIYLKFTVKALRDLPLSSDKTRSKYRDQGGAQSFRGLVLHVGVKAKVFYFYGKLSGRSIRHRIGEFPATTIEQARKRCVALAADIDKGENPVEKKRNSRQRGLTFSEAFEQYISVASSRAAKPIRQSTIDNYRRSLALQLLQWKTKPCSEIDYSDVELWYTRAAKVSPTAANSALRVGRAVFNHQIDISNRQQSSAFTYNPFVGHTLIAEKARTECIEFSELPDWFDAVATLQSETTRDYLTLLLFTGLRRREASPLKWKDIDLQKKILIARDTKNGTDHILPLSMPVHELLTRRKLVSVSKWVFPGSGKHGYIAEPKKAIARIAELSDIRCSPHGLRRTFSNLAAFKARVPEPVRKILMNHAADRRDVTGFNYTTLPLEEQRPFMQEIADAILAGAKHTVPIANVVKLQAAN